MPTTTVTTAVTKVAGPSAEETAVRVHNTSAAAIVFGTDNSILTPTNGYAIAAGGSETFHLTQGEVLYGIVASGSGTVDWL